MPLPSNAGEPHPCPRRVLAYLAVLLALLWFVPLDTPHLFDPDEGRYGEIPREMVASGNWVTPRLDGIKYFEKPPLQYWASAVAFEVAGEHAWTVRLWPALCGFLGLLLSFGLGRRLYGPRSALFAVIVQASALLYLGMARIATLDMGLCFTLQLAMTALALLVQRRGQAAASAPPPSSPAASWRLPLLLGVGVALAVLAKGLVGILIPGAVALVFMLVYRDWRLLVAARPWWTLLALLLLAAPWFALVSVRNPEFARFFFIFEHFQRYLNRAGFDRYQPVWFFVPVLLVGFLPWTTLLPRALAEAVRAARAGERATALLLIWAAFVFVFFSLSQSKLVPYVLPAIPALSLLTGRTLSALPARRLSAHLTGVAAAAALIAAMVLLSWQLPAARALAARASSASLLGFAAAFALLALGAAVGAYWCRRGRMLLGAASGAVGSLLLAQAALLGADQLPRMRGEVLLTRALKPWIDDYRHFYCVNDYIQTVPFYLARTCTLVGYRGELDFGLRQQPALALPDLSHFAGLWRQQNSALALLRPQDYQQLEAMGVPLHVIYTAPSFVAVVRQ